MCAVEAQRCVDCGQRGVAGGAYTRTDSQAGFRRQQACLAYLDQLRPCGQIDLLVDDNDRDLWEIAHRDPTGGWGSC